MARGKYKREKSEDYENHYVDQFKFKEALVDYYALCKDYSSRGLDSPPIPAYIGDSVFRIAKKLSNSFNFRNYSYLDDMIGEAVVHCLKKIHKFNPELGTSAFSYFTSIVWYSFIGTITKEKKEAQSKYRAFLSGDYESYVAELNEEQKLEFHEVFSSINIGDEPLSKDISPRLSREEKRKAQFDNLQPKGEIPLL